MEDGDDKIRRNLVVSSGAVLLSAWLNIPYAAIIEKATGFTKSAPSESDLVAAALALFVYQLIRYKFSDEATGLQKQFVQDYDARLRRNILRFLQSEMDRFTKTGRESVHFHNEIGTVTRSIARSAGLQANDWPRPKVALDDHGGTDIWNMLLMPTLTWPFFKDVGPIQRNGMPLSAVIDGPRKRRIQLTTWLSTAAYSRISIRLLAPLFLCSAAIVTLICRLLT